jgi:hypothetical protein
MKIYKKSLGNAIFLWAPYESSHKTEKVWGKNTLLTKMNLKIGHKRLGHSWIFFRMSKKSSE